MKKSRYSEHGYGAPAIVFAIFVILTGLVGYYVYRHKYQAVVVQTSQSAKTSSTGGSTSSTAHPLIPVAQPPLSSSRSPSNNLNIIKIPELGIEITVPNSIKDLTYHVSSS